MLYFGSPKEGGDHEDHWVLEEIRHLIGSGVPCLAYLSKDFPEEILVKHGYNGEVRVLSTEADFGAALQRDLNVAIASR